MRKFLGVTFLLSVLAACSVSAPNDGPNDAPGYFDSTTPDPATLEGKAQENRLAQAEEQPQTVLPPSGDTASAKDKTKVIPEGDGSISNSQDFGATKAKESIESDAEKLKLLKENYEIVEPGKLPVRPNGEINVAKYALSQSNPVGTKIYSRFSMGGFRLKKKCEGYASADEAQADFLRRGGPKRDPRGIDPDGDGYACAWTPDVYRAMIGQ